MLRKAARQVRQNFVAYLALFFAVSGTAMAAKPLITGADIEDESVTGADIDEFTLGTVQAAQFADFADTAENAINAAPSAAEEFHNVGDPGEPSFENGWTNAEAGYLTTAGFYKDPWGLVHLKGHVERVSDGVPAIFVLPEEYRPAKYWHFDNGACSLWIAWWLGEVSATGTSCVLDGITFRAGS